MTSYKQQKFNLLREESEGYIKLVVELDGRLGPAAALDDAADGDTHRLIRTYGNYITYLQNVRRASGQSNILVTPIPRRRRIRNERDQDRTVLF